MHPRHWRPCGPTCTSLFYIHYFKEENSAAGGGLAQHCMNSCHLSLSQDKKVQGCRHSPLVFFLSSLSLLMR